MYQNALKYPITAEFLDALRLEKIALGVGKHLHIQTLLQELPDETDAESLKFALVSLIAQTPQEQEKLYEIFDAAVKRVNERLPKTIDPSVPNDKNEDENNFTKVSDLRKVVLPIVLTLLLAIGGGLWWKSHQNPPKPIESKPDTTAKFQQDTIKTTKTVESNFFVDKSYPFPNHLNEHALKPPSKTQEWLSNNWAWLRWFLALVLTALLLAIWWYRAWKRRKLIAQQDQNEKPPYIWNIHIEGIQPVEMGNSLDKVTQTLRQRTQTDTHRMDVERTINATIEQGGMPQFRYKRNTRPTDYLLLIDRQSVRNHRAQLFDTLYEVFKAQEVDIARFFFDSDIRVCYSEDYSHGIALADLQQRYYQSRLLIVGTGGQMLSPSSGKVAEWTKVFKQWKDRVLFSPKPLKSWAYDERQIASLFTTLPATLQSLGFWVEEVEAGADARFDTWQEKINDAPYAPIVPDDNDPVPILDLYFEPDMLRWIAACAIYPTLHWDLTLWIGQQIGRFAPMFGELSKFPEHNTPLSTFDNLSQLTRLSWFVTGEMPIETRIALLDWLEKTDKPLLTSLRAAIAEELSKNPPPKDSAAFDKFRLNIALNQWLATTDAATKKKLETEISQLLERGTEHDFTFLKYLNAPQTALDFMVPDAWKKYVYPAGYRALGWLKELKDLWWLAMLWLFGLVSLFYPYHFDTFNCSKDRIVQLTTRDTLRTFCLDDPLSALTYQEQLIRDNFSEYYEEDPLLKAIAQETLNRLIKEGDTKKINEYKALINKPKLVDSLLAPDARLNLPNYYHPFSVNQLLKKEQLNDKKIQSFLSERDRNLAIDFYLLAKKLYQNGEQDSACWALANAIALDSIDAEIKVAQAFVCPNTMAATKPLFDIAPSIKGIVQSAGNAGFLKDFSADFKQFQANTPTPLPDVQIRGAGVNTRTDAKGNYTLKLPPQYPNATIVLTFTKEGFNTVTQTFTIDKVKQLPTVRLVSNATKPVEPTKKDGSTTTPPSPKAPSVGTGKDTTVTAQNTAQNTAASESIFAPTMVDVKGGTFQMGSNEYDDEKPIHSVTVSDFAIGKYEVTQKQWRDVMGSDPPELNFKGCDQCPVENVSWNDIQEFLQKLNQKTGKKYRLPTEAEWEYAARGGNKSRGYTYSGSNTVGDVAWYTDNSGYKTHPVGTKGANELGIHDMSGNVWEWCSDWYGDYSNAAVSNPMGAAKGSYRVFRGGSWLRNAVLCRVASRNNSTPTARSLYLGFRLALSSLQ